MVKLFEICDEMASCGEYVTLKAIVEKCLEHEVSKLEGIPNYANLRKQLGIINSKDNCIDYKNKRNLRGGFRYKKGFEYYFKNKEENAALNRLEGDEKKLYKTGGLQMLFDGNSSSEHYVELEWVSNLENLELVKILIVYIKARRVISFRYNKGFSEEMEITMHPFLLKEYNSRWFLFGYKCQQGGTWEVINVALDRIISDDKKKSCIKAHPEIKYKEAPKNFNNEYFKDIIGVTRHPNDTVEVIIIKTVDFKVHHLLKTKPIHSSQIETVQFNEEKMEGEFSIKVIPNIELQTRLLSYGSGLYVVGEGQFQQQMHDAILQMAKLYRLSPTDKE